MKTRSTAGFTRVELLVAVGVGLLLWSLALPSSPGGLGHGHMTQALSDMKQLHLATQQMVLDGVATDDKKLGWPGDQGGSFYYWELCLLHGNYFSKNDLSRLLAAASSRQPPGELPLRNDNPVLVYAVKKDSPADAVFLSSANFRNSPSNGTVDPAVQPFGNKGFVVFRKGGDGSVLMPRQAGSTNVGGYAPLCR